MSPPRRPQPQPLLPFPYMIFIKVLDSRLRGNDGSSASRLRRRIGFAPAPPSNPRRRASPTARQSPRFRGNRLRRRGPSFPRKRESISLAAPCCKPRHCPYMTTGVIWRDEDDPRHPRRPARGRPAHGRSAGAVFPAGVARSDRRRSRNPLSAVDTNSSTRTDGNRARAAVPSNRMIGETADMDILQRFARRPPVVGGVVHAARSAAVCGAHGTEVLRTRDRDFSSGARSRLAGALGTRRASIACRGRSLARRRRASRRPARPLRDWRASRRCGHCAAWADGLTTGARRPIGPWKGTPQ